MRRQGNTVNSSVSQTFVPSPVGLLPKARVSCCLGWESFWRALDLPALLHLLGPLCASAGLWVPLSVWGSVLL